MAGRWCNKRTRTFVSCCIHTVFAPGPAAATTWSTSLVSASSWLDRKAYKAWTPSHVIERVMPFLLPLVYRILLSWRIQWPSECLVPARRLCGLPAGYASLRPCLWLCLSVCLSVCLLSLSLSLYTHTHTHTHPRPIIYIYMYVCVRVCACVCACVWWSFGLISPFFHNVSLVTTLYHFPSFVVCTFLDFALISPFM